MKGGGKVVVAFAMKVQVWLEEGTDLAIGTQSRLRIALGHRYHENNAFSFPLEARYPVHSANKA